MKKIYYEEGPPALYIVNVGMFQIKVPKEVSDEYAAALVKKGTFKYAVEKQSKSEELVKSKVSRKVDKLDEFLPIGGN